MQRIFPQGSVLALVIAVLGLGVVAGCETAPGVNKQMNVYSQWVPVSEGEAAEAVYQTIAELNLQAISETTPGSKRLIKTRNRFGTNVTIAIELEGVDSTRIGVDVAPGASEGYAQMVFNTIQKHLVAAGAMRP